MEQTKAPTDSPMGPKETYQNFTRKQKFFHLFWEFLKFEIGLGLVLLVAGGIYFVANDYSLANYRFWFEALWYPIAFLYVVFYITHIRKRRFRDFLLNAPKWPEKGHRWFYIAWSVFFGAVFVTWLILLGLGLARIQGTLIVILVGLWHSCIGAPIVEEILFRGYWFARGEEVYGKDRWFISWDREEFNPEVGEVRKDNIMTFQITYAAMISSLFFGLWHINPIQALYTLFMGLFFCKTRREWGRSLVPAMILHSSGNFLVQILSITNFTFMNDLLAWLTQFM